MHSRIFLVRHGATVLTAEDRFAGATDVELSDEGREQVRRLADRLAQEEIVAVYASPLGRTVETAQRIRLHYIGKLPGNRIRRNRIL